MTTTGTRDSRAGWHRPRVAVAAVLIAVAAAVGAAAHDDDDRDHGERRAYAIGLWGDLPYSDVQAAAIPALLADMNRHDLAFSVNDGDLKGGSGTPCDEALYQRALGWLNALSAPAAFTPGDNDWTDCDRPSNGGYNSRERLDRERAIFFSTKFTQGKHRLRQDVQTDALCLNVAGLAVPCVENRRWTYGDVTYVTLNLPGSCNNLCDTAPDPAEYAARNHANIVWMRDAFEEATRRRSAAVMIVAQANPGWDLADPTRAPVRDPKTLWEADPLLDGYHDFLAALRAEVIAFRRPVAFVHGDSHYFRVDKPFLDDAGRRLENFTRLETFGDNQANGTNDVQWVEVTVDPRSREVFSYQPQMVPANRVAVPAP